MRLNATGALLGIVLALPSAARAQSSAWTDRGYVNVNGWYQPAAGGFSSTVRPVNFVEPSVVETSYKTPAVPGFDAGGGIRVWRNLAVGLDVSYLSKSSGGAVSAQIPHPFFFNRLRAVSGDASGLERTETAVHAQVLWLVPIGARWQLALSGGPSWFNAGQDLVQTVTITESYPFDTATFAGITSARRTGSGAGFNAGGDVAYMFTPTLGIGFTANFSRARVALDDTVTIDAGGAHLGGGLRLRF